jgi:hypothetical protein
VCKLWACLDQGMCSALEELGITDAPAQCLREGLAGCPNLRRLRLDIAHDPPLVALGAALEQGLYPKLEVLSVTARRYPGVNGGDVVATALRAFPRPALRELDLDTWILGAGLAGALQSGACPGLTRLNLVAMSFGEGTDVEELVEALGACPNLRQFGVRVPTGEGMDSLYLALAEAVREGGLPSLEKLSLFNFRVRDDSARALAEALEARAGPLVRFDDFSTRGLGFAIIMFPSFDAAFGDF